MNKFLVFFTLITVVSACNSSKRISNSKDKSTSSAESAGNLQQKQSEGVDFFAKGKLPSSWTLEIDFDKAIRFKSLDGTNIIASSTKPVEFKEEKRTSITTNTEFGKMQVDIITQECTDELSGEKFAKRVTVQINGKTYEGCGSFLYDANIAGKWTLQQWNGKKLSATDFAKGLPQIQFDVAANRVNGHDGCNQFFGVIELRGNFINIDAIGSTKMACLNNKVDVPLPGKISNKIISYYFKEGFLYLYLPDDTIAIFSK